MFCTQCGAKIAETTQFCTNCGTAIPAGPAPTAPEYTPPAPPEYQAQPQYQPPPPQYAATVPPETAGPDFTTDKGIAALEILTGAAQLVLGIFLFLFVVLLPKFSIDLSGTAVDIGFSYLMYGIMGVQSVFALIKGVRYKKILLIATSIAVLLLICGIFLVEMEEGFLFAFWLFFIFSVGSCFITQKSFTKKKEPNPFSVNPQTTGGSVFSLNPGTQSAPVTLEGMCTLVEIHEQDEVFNGQKVCNLQITPECIRFVPSAYTRFMRGLTAISDIINIVTGNVGIGGPNTFTAKDIREIPLTAITNIQKKKNSLEITAGDQFMYKFVLIGKTKKAYEPLLQLWNAARQSGGGN